MIGASVEPWTHGAASDAGRVALRLAPADFIADLRSLAGIDYVAVTETTLDGGPALMTATTPGTIFTGYDIHVNGPMTDMGVRDYVGLASPYRLIVTQRGGETVLVIIWARTDEGLAAWMPTAMQVVDSIHFIDQP